MTFQYKLTEKVGVFTKKNGTIAYIARIDAQNNPVGSFSRIKGVKA